MVLQVVAAAVVAAEVAVAVLEEPVEQWSAKLLYSAQY